MMADSSEYTPETIARRLDIAKQLLADGQPVKHWAQGLNELLKGYTGGNIYRGAEQAEMRGEAGLRGVQLFLPSLSVMTSTSGWMPVLARSSAA